MPPLFHLGSTQSQPPALLIIARVLLIVDQLQPGACIALSCILCGQPESAAIIAPVHPGLAHPGVVAPWCPLCALLPPVSVSLLLRHAVAAWCLHYAVMPFVGQHALCNIAPALLSLGEVCSACRQPALCIVPCTPRSLVSRPCYQTCTHIRQAACIVQCPLYSLVSSFLAAGRAVTACRLAVHISVQLQPGDLGAACIVHCSLHSSLLSKYVLCCRTCSRNLPPPLHIVAQVLLSVEQSQLGACFVRSCPSLGSLHCALSPALIAHAGRAVAACRLHCILSLKSCSPWSSRSLVPALRVHALRILPCTPRSLVSMFPCCRTCSRNLPPPLHIVAQVLLTVEQSQLGACFVRCPLHSSLMPDVQSQPAACIAYCRSSPALRGAVAAWCPHCAVMPTAFCIVPCTPRSLVSMFPCCQTCSRSLPPGRSQCLLSRIFAIHWHSVLGSLHISTALLSGWGCSCMALACMRSWVWCLGSYWVGRFRGCTPFPQSLLSKHQLCLGVLFGSGLWQGCHGYHLPWRWLSSRLATFKAPTLHQ